MLGRTALRGQTQDKTRSAGAEVFVLKAFRRDLAECWDPLAAESQRLAESGWPIPPLRVLVLAVWMATEPQGYYRAKA